VNVSGNAGIPKQSLSDFSYLQYYTSHRRTC